MKRILLLIGMLATFALTAGTAQADKINSPNCGNVAGHWATAQAPTWSNISNGWGHVALHWTQLCGTDPDSVEVELQYSDDGGLHWYDRFDELNVQIDVDFATPSSMDNVQKSRTSTWQANVYCHEPGSPPYRIYRDHVWYSGGDDKSPSMVPNC